MEEGEEGEEEESKIRCMEELEVGESGVVGLDGGWSIFSSPLCISEVVLTEDGVGLLGGEGEADGGKREVGLQKGMKGMKEKKRKEKKRERYD